jgi:hypothetical protein
MLPHLLVWDQENYSEITSAGYTMADVEDILLNPRNDSHYDEGSSLSGITYGTTSSGKSIGVTWAIECGNPLHVYAVGIIPNSSKPQTPT